MNFSDSRSENRGSERRMSEKAPVSTHPQCELWRYATWTCVRYETVPILYSMSQLWFPGRPPMCSNELIWLTGQFAETLFELIANRDPDKLGVLECITADALFHIIDESEECLGTDDVLNNIQELFEKSMNGAITYYKAGAWDHLLELATSMTTVRDQLIEEMGKVQDATSPAAS